MLLADNSTSLPQPLTYFNVASRLLENSILFQDPSFFIMIIRIFERVMVEICPDRIDVFRHALDAHVTSLSKRLNFSPQPYTNPLTAVEDLDVFSSTPSTFPNSTLQSHLPAFFKDFAVANHTFYHMSMVGMAVCSGKHASWMKHVADDFLTCWSLFEADKDDLCQSYPTMVLQLSSNFIQDKFIKPFLLNDEPQVARSMVGIGKLNNLCHLLVFLKFDLSRDFPLLYHLQGLEVDERKAYLIQNYPNLKPFPQLMEEQGQMALFSLDTLENEPLFPLDLPLYNDFGLVLQFGWPW